MKKFLVQLAAWSLIILSFDFYFTTNPKDSLIRFAFLLLALAGVELYTWAERKFQ